MTNDVLLIVFLLMGSAFCSASETALTTVSRVKVRNKATSGNKAAILLEKLLSKPGKLLATILAGNNLVNIAISVIATTFCLKLLEMAGLHSIAAASFIITVAVSSVILVFGEIAPKMFALSKAEKLALLVVRPIILMEKMLAPFVFIVNGLSKLLVRAIGGKPLEKGKFVTEEELKTLIAIGQEEGVLEKEEGQMLTSVMDLGERTVREIMTPRVDMFCIDIETPLSELLAIVSEQGHSRVPVYEENQDNIIGVIYAKDLLRASVGLEQEVQNLLRAVQFVPETKRIDDLLKKMRTKRSHIAIVVDEHGGVSGLVTIEDILEEIVGDIEDEYDDKEPPPLQKTGDFSYAIDAGMNVYDVNSALDLNISDEEDYDTIGGFVVHLLGEIPKVGDHAVSGNLQFEVTEVIGQRVTKVLLNIHPKPMPESEGNA